MTEVGFSFGSNVGDKATAIHGAVTALVEGGVVTDLAVSRLYRTAPWGHVVEQDWFVNACAVGTTGLAPRALLDAVKTIEVELGRTASVRWGPRVIDIDILYYGDLALDTEGLVLPHRDILNRAFVLVPLAELRPDRRIAGVTVREAARALGAGGVEPLGSD